MTNLFGQSRWLATTTSTMDSLSSIYACTFAIVMISQTHLVVAPMFEHHTAKNMFNMVVKFFDAL
jgi:hypothetical protein